MLKTDMWRGFWAILIMAFLFRVGVAFLAPHPGISDSNHYYNLAKNVAEGRGFVIDYIWNYYTQPADVTHPEDYWMPLPAVYPALMLRFFPDNLFMALLPSVLFGVGVVAMTFALAKALGLSDIGGLVAMALVAFLPELVLNSARTDTTISYVFYMSGLFWSLLHAVRGHPRWFLVVGLCAGLAHLTRQDAILLIPAIGLALFVHARWGTHPLAWRWVLAIPLVWLLVLAPWLWRNYELFGVFLSSGSGRTIFMTSFIDQFTYGRTLDLQHWLDWGIPNIVGNIAFQTLANVRMMLTLPDVLLPVMGLLGLAVWTIRRDRDKALFLALPILTVLVLFAFYSIVTPFHTQGGSFKKSFMLFLPIVAIIATDMLMEFSRPQRIAYAITGITAVLMAMNAFQLIREDFAIAKRFNESVVKLDHRLQELGDVNGDGEIIVMTQDPFILNYHGYRALMIPSDPRDMILEACYRYRVDYIILPAARVALDDLVGQAEIDPRLQWYKGTENYQLLAVVPNELHE